MTKNNNVQQVQKVFGDIASTIDALSDDLTPRLKKLIQLIGFNDIGVHGDFATFPVTADRQFILEMDKSNGTNFADDLWPDKPRRSDKLRKRSMRRERRSL